MNIIEWAQSKFGFYTDRWYDTASGQWVLQPGPIRLAPYHADLLAHIFTPDDTGRLRYDIAAWCEPAKSGKTAIAGLAAEWMALHGDPNSSIVMASNKQNQAASLMYKSLVDSIEYNPHLPKVDPGRLAVRFRNGTEVKAIASNSRGEAGARFSLSIFDELWGYTFEDSIRLWTEFKTDPTRLNSVKMAIGYAGYSSESELWQNLLEDGLAGEPVKELEHITNDDGQPACWANGRTFVFWSHVCRQPWQTQEWIDEQAKTLRPAEFRRMIQTEFVPISESNFIEPEWWDSCYDPAVTLRPGDKTPIILALDLAMGSPAGDAIALVGVSKWGDTDYAVKYCRIWDSPGTRFDFDATAGQALDWLLSNYAVQMITFDPYQALHFMSGYKGRTWLKEFSQTTERSLSDKMLYDCIASRRLHHNGDEALKKHILNAGAKSTGEADKLRIVKSHPARKIDAAVALSMSLYRCAQLNLPGDPAGLKPRSETESAGQMAGVPTDDNVMLEYMGDVRGNIMTVSGLRQLARGQQYTVSNETWASLKEFRQDRQWRKIR